VSGPPPSDAHAQAFDALRATYRTPEGHYDELFDERGRLRPAWAGFGRHEAHLTAATLSAAQSRVSRQIHESSITHAVYAAADARPRPWTLDALPLVVPGPEWAALASGVAQLARLLNLVAADIYGARSLLRDGTLPPALLFRHPGFLRACDAVVPPAAIYLHQVAFDLARGEDARWHVVTVRTQTPAGAGYALENRATIVRMFPDAFRELHVQAIAPYFAVVRETLMRTAPCDDGPPQVVLLTPGPYSGRYFEHAYLARYFGFALVEGADLTVRHDRVFLKTIDGLRQVHAVVRHLADDFCDPLELRADSALGVPGFVQAWRAGRVLVANAFGTGVLESAALRGLLPQLAQRLLGTPLTLPVLPSRWRDDPAATEPIVADATVVPSYAPVWHDDHLDARPILFRAFAVAGHDGGYTVMPGGLTRHAAAGQAAVTSGSGGSKDTWILSAVTSEPRVVELLMPTSTPVDGARAAGSISSRAAEHLFWLGRYVERAETSARLLRTALNGLGDPSTPEVPREAFLRIAIGSGVLDRDDPSLEPTGTLPGSALIARLIDNLFDAHGHESLAFNVRQTVRVAGAIRDRLSTDNWRLLNQLFALTAVRPPKLPDLHETLAVLERAIISLVAVAGLEMAHMSRDHGWRFLSVGRHLERFLSIAVTFLALGPKDASDPQALELLLRASDSLGPFRARYGRRPDWPAVASLVLFDTYNPRSLVFQLTKIAKHVPLLPGAASLDVVSDLTGLEAAMPDIDRAPGAITMPWVGDLLQNCEQIALQLSDALTSRYFSHAYELPHVTAGR
jgi:uncharacterized circularly permuted ATP-grasp superfamily protein/uncharacterized alpha-E superfamily protein